MEPFDTKYKPSFRICESVSDKDVNAQDSTGKIRQVSIQHLHLYHPIGHVLTHVCDMTSSG